jgi:hypothetical protein
MPAHLFYRSTKSRWICAVLEYLSAREFPREDAFFVSLVNQKIYGYEEVIHPYPKSKYHPRKKECAAFAREILTFIQAFREPIFVELHMSGILAYDLIPLFKENDIPFRFYGEGVSLAAKPVYYQRLIDEELEKRKVRQIKQEKWALVAGIVRRSPTEAQRILDDYGHKSYLFPPNVEPHLEELKHLLKKHHERKKHEKEAFDEFVSQLEKEEDAKEFESFMSSVNFLYQLVSNRVQYEAIKGRFGRTMSKFERYLIKREYALEIENKISAALLRLQIMLL